MRSSSQALLEAWERALPLSPGRRAIVLLDVAGAAEPQQEIAAISVGRRDAALMALREAAFGPHVTGVSACPDCREVVELDFDLDDVRVPVGSPDSDAAMLRIDRAPWSVTFRVPMCADLVCLDECASPQEGRALLLERCVKQVRRGGEPARVDELPEDLRRAVNDAMEAADPQADVRLLLSCPGCGNEWQQGFDILTFLWAELDSWARRLLGEVHLLARAYGWSEQQVLALSPLRRRAYLDLVTV